MMRRRKFFSRLCIMLAAGFLFAACEHADPLETGGLQPTLTSIQENIFNLNCALSNCHGSSPQRELDLREGAARTNLVGVDSRGQPEFLRVDPGNPDDSYLVMKLEGDPRIIGSRMPLGREPLSSEEIAVIREWILGGAE